MGITSLQVCMDSSDWLQGTISDDDHGDQMLDSSPIMRAPSSDDILAACSGTLIERRLRPQHEQSLKCPRCESTHTKFCYYNNYSLLQPRYFCKTCRRYWTKGGTLRNIPVGGGCRKNKKVSSNSKKNSNDNNNNNNSSSNNNNNNICVNQSPAGSLLSSPTSLFQQNNSINGLLMSSTSSAFSCYNLNNNNNNPNPADLHLAFPEMPFSSSSNTLGFLTSNSTNPGHFLLENNNNSPVPIHDFMLENKYDAIVGGGQDYNMGHAENYDGINVVMNGGLMTTTHDANLHGICSPFVMSTSLDHHGISSANGNAMAENFQRLMMPYNDQTHHHDYDHIEDRNYQEVNDVKPISTKIVSLEWHDHYHREQVQAGDQKDAAFGYNNVGGLGSWTGLTNGCYGSSATNPLV